MITRDENENGANLNFDPNNFERIGKWKNFIGAELRKAKIIEAPQQSAGRKFESIIKIDL